MAGGREKHAAGAKVASTAKAQAYEVAVSTELAAFASILTASAKMSPSEIAAWLADPTYDMGEKRADIATRSTNALTLCHVHPMLKKCDRVSARPHMHSHSLAESLAKLVKRLGKLVSMRW